MLPQMRIVRSTEPICRSTSRYVLRYAERWGCTCLQGLRSPSGSCKLLKCLLLSLWHGRGHRFDPGQVHQTIKNLRLAILLRALHIHSPVCGCRIVECLGSALAPRRALHNSQIPTSNDILESGKSVSHANTAAKVPIPPDLSRPLSQNIGDVFHPCTRAIFRQWQRCDLGPTGYTRLSQSRVIAGRACPRSGLADDAR